jgi:predicted RNA-binding Zn-ribbon protein involved in translation (DUF1610 family)
MDAFALIVGLALFGAAAVFVARPFRSRQPAGRGPKAATVHPGEARAAALSALRSLDFDFQTGKVSEEDYPALRLQLVAEAARYVDASASEDDRVEAMIRARRAASGEPCPKCGKKAAADARFCPECGAELAAACPSCGKSVRAGDLFCTSCGSRLELRVGAAA